jgi:hypothetical protein
MKAMIIVLAATVAACQATTSSEASKIQSVSASSTAFAVYRTFGFGPSGAPPAPTNCPPNRLKWSVACTIWF